jgi:hypothetical protein
MLKTLVALLTVFLANPSPGQHVTVPRGSPVMIDGRISPKEWRDAKFLAFGEARIWMKQASNYVFFAIQFPPGTHGFTDLMISPVAGQMMDLHASAKLGERTWGKQGWSDWNWWNNDGWMANVSRVDSFDKKSFFAENVREYQIRRSRFPSKTWKVMVQLSIESNDGSFHTVALPENAAEADPSNWIQLTFSPGAPDRGNNVKPR